MEMMEATEFIEAPSMQQESQNMKAFLKPMVVKVFKKERYVSPKPAIQQW